MAGNKGLYDPCKGGCGKPVFNRHGYCLKCKKPQKCIECKRTFLIHAESRTRCHQCYRAFIKHGETPKFERDSHTVTA